MADLESFFAKKDKKKKSKKGVDAFTPDDLLKKIEEDTQGGGTDAEYESFNGENSSKVSSLNLPPGMKVDDDEWNEFETDREVDLSTLKIQNLKEKEKERLEEEEREEFQKALEESKTTMKWNIARKPPVESDPEDNVTDANEGDAVNQPNNGSEKPTTEAESPSPASPAAPAKAVSSGAEAAVDKATGSTPSRYIPPSLRNQPAATAAASNFSTPSSGGPALTPISIKRTSARNRKPDVNSIEEFPSLGTAVPSRPAAGQDAAVGGAAFTSVRKGARGATDAVMSSDATALSTSNKFSMLKSSAVGGESGK